MSQISQVNSGVTHFSTRQVASAGSANVPAELRGARPSTAAVVGRVFAGIFTLGISEGIRAIVRHARAGAAPQARVPEQRVPQAPPRADLVNQGIANGLRNGALSPEHGAAVREAIDELRARFGADLLPEGTTFKTLPSSYQLQDNVAAALRNLPDEASPQKLRDLILDNGAPLMAEQLLQQRAAEHAVGLAENSNVASLGGRILHRYPDLKAELRACGNRAEADRVLGAAAPRINAYCDLTRAIDGAKASALATAVTNLASQTGLPETAIRDQVDFGKLENTWTYLGQDLLSGAKQLEGEAITAAFQAKAEAFAERKAQLFTSVDTLGLSPTLADAWKTDALRQKTLDDADMFVTLHKVGAGINAQRLLTALNEPEGEITDRELLGLMESLGAALNEALFAQYGPEGWNELGGDGQGDARFYAAQAMLDAVPNLRETLGSRPELVARLNDLAGEDMDIGGQQGNSTNTRLADQGILLRQSAVAVQMMLLNLPRPAAESNRELADALGRGRSDMSAAHIQSLNRGVVELRDRFGQDCLPAGDAFKAISAWNPGSQSSVSRLLSNAIRTAELPVASHELGRLLEANARPAAAYGAFRALLGEMARDMGLSVEADRIAAVANTLRQRHPQLSDALSRAENRAGVKALLDGFPEAASLLRVESDVQAAWAKGLEDIYDGIREATGLSGEAVRSRLNIGAVDRGGRFHYLQQDIREACGKPGTSAIPSSEQIRDDYQGIVDRFLTNKRGLYQSVDTLGLSPALTASWKDEVLTNSTLRSADFLRKCATVAQGMTDAGLLAALNEPTMSTSDLLGIFRSIGMRMDQQAHAVFSPDEFRDMGSDDLAALNAHAREAFLDRRTDLVDAMRANADRMRGLQTQCEQELGSIQREMSRVADHTSPQMAALQAEYASVASALSILAAVVPME